MCNQWFNNWCKNCGLQIIFVFINNQHLILWTFILYRWKIHLKNLRWKGHQNNFCLRHQNLLPRHWMKFFQWFDLNKADCLCNILSFNLKINLHDDFVVTISICPIYFCECIRTSNRANCKNSLNMRKTAVIFYEFMFILFFHILLCCF